MAAEDAKLEFGFDSPLVLSLTGMVQGQEGESVHMDVSFPAAMHMASHSTFVIPPHTHTLDQCQQVKVSNQPRDHKLATLGPIIHGMNQSPLHYKI